MNAKIGKMLDEIEAQYPDAMDEIDALRMAVTDDEAPAEEELPMPEGEDEASASEPTEEQSDEDLPFYS